MIDEDLGRSGATAAGRSGFSELVADVGLGKDGIILALEVSRLARSNADWYQLLDLCALTDTLIADADGIYHPGSYNDRLILGLKGTMSEAELHLIRSRLTEGLRHKAARGELRQGLPVGLDYDQGNRVIITPDEAVREAIATVYRRFAELGSARQVLLSLREDGLLLPRRPTGTGRVSWAQASYPAVHDFLSNPAYAGAFVFGRTRTEKRIDPAGRLITRTRLLPRDQWAVLIPGHHRGFISWETYEANTAALRADWRPPRGARRRRPAGRDSTAAGPAALRQVRADHADRVLRAQGQQPPVRVRPRETAVRHRARLLQHRRRAAGEDHPGRAVHRAGARVPAGHRQGDGRGREPVPAAAGRLRAGRGACPLRS